MDEFENGNEVLSEDKCITWEGHGMGMCLVDDGGCENLCRGYMCKRRDRHMHGGYMLKKRGRNMCGGYMLRKE